MNAPRDIEPVLTGAYGPVENEVASDALHVIGEIPPDLNGLYVRNGPNRKYAAPGRYHWFDGDGMLHGMWFDRGRVRYANRFVATAQLDEEISAGRALWQGIKDPPRRDRASVHAARGGAEGPLKNTSNTDVKFWNGKLISTWYLGGTPYAVDPWSLDTLGPIDCDGRLKLPVSAHPKVDAATGELMFFAYGTRAPYMHYGVLGADGALKTLIPVELPGARLPHDMAITPNYSILHDLPLFHDQEALRAGRHKLKFHHELPSRFAVVPRHGSASEIRWFEADPGFLYHTVNAWEEGDEIVMLGTPFRLPRNAQGETDCTRFAQMIGNLETDCGYYEWRFNLKTGATRERALSDLVNTEFPVINAARQGTRTHHAWSLLMGPSRQPEEPRFAGLVQFNAATGAMQTWSEGPENWYSEAPFAPRDGATEENDGYLVGFVWNAADARSECQVFDAREIGRGPLARIITPQRVPHGFHAAWVGAEALKSAPTKGFRGASVTQ